MKELILATANLGKITEFQSLLAPIRCLSQLDLAIESVPETGLSFVENALLKARHVSQLANKPALADDSGLVVPALEGAPGIYSARYTGLHANQDDNINFLLTNLNTISTANREAYFYCVLVFIRHAKDPAPIIATGRFDGIIAKERAGTAGFGYDSIFYLPQFNYTVAQLPAAIKNKYSHRAQALAQLKRQL